MATAKKKTHEDPPTRTRVLIVDDHPVMRHGFAQRINLKPNLYVCTNVGTATRRCTRSTRSKRMWYWWTSLGRRRRREDPGGFGHQDTVYADRCIGAGVHGYLHKSEALDNTVDVIRRVIPGRLTLPQSRPFGKATAGGVTLGSRASGF